MASDLLNYFGEDFVNIWKSEKKDKFWITIVWLILSKALEKLKKPPLYNVSGIHFVVLLQKICTCSMIISPPVS